MNDLEEKIKNSPYLNQENLDQYHRDVAEYLEEEIKHMDDAIEQTMSKISKLVVFHLI
jgi:predicted ribosome quality control (RQC) complex YloA/Tae2 family protein